MANGLDLTTIYIMSAMASLLLGLVQLVAHLSGRFGVWARWWALGNLTNGATGMTLLLHGHLPDIMTIGVGNVVTVTAAAMMVQGVRAYAGRPLHAGFVALVLATWIPLLSWTDPADFARRVATVGLLRISFDVMVGIETWRIARRERLVTAWTMTALFWAGAVLFSLRSLLGFQGHLGTSQFDGREIGDWVAAMTTIVMVVRSSTLMQLEAERSREALSTLARTDALTGASNRVRLAELSGSLTGPVGLLLVDLDHFKALNDRHGHAAGDAVLVALAGAARAVAGARPVIRLGGDEFLLVLPDAGAADLAAVALRLRTAFAERVTGLFADISPPTISAGTDRGDLRTEPFAAILSRADAALYAAKRDGRDRIAGHG